MSKRLLLTALLCMVAIFLATAYYPAPVGAANYRAMEGAGYQYVHVTTASTQVLNGPGVLRSIVINGPASAGVTLTVYDNTAGSGDIIAIITLAAASVPVALPYNIRCATGIYVKESGTQTYDVTVAYTRE